MDHLFHFFQTQFLTFSAKYGLLGDMDGLTVAGDGTPIFTITYPEAYQLVIVIPKAFLNTTIPGSTLYTTATRDGIAPV